MLTQTRTFTDDERQENSASESIFEMENSRPNRSVTAQGGDTSTFHQLPLLHEDCSLPSIPHTCRRRQRRDQTRLSLFSICSQDHLNNPPHTHVLIPVCDIIISYAFLNSDAGMSVVGGDRGQTASFYFRWLYNFL